MKTVVRVLSFISPECRFSLGTIRIVRPRSARPVIRRPTLVGSSLFGLPTQYEDTVTYLTGSFTLSKIPWPRLTRTPYSVQDHTFEVNSTHRLVVLPSPPACLLKPFLPFCKCLLAACEEEQVRPKETGRARANVPWNQAILHMNSWKQMYCKMSYRPCHHSHQFVRCGCGVFALGYMNNSCRLPITDRAWFKK